MRKQLIEAYKAGLRRALMLTEGHAAFNWNYLETVLLRLKREGKILPEAIVEVVRIYEKMLSNEMSFNGRLEDVDLNKLAEDTAARLCVIFGGDADRIKNELVRAFRLHRKVLQL